MRINNKGQTIIEAIIGFALISIVGLAFVGGLVSLRNTTKNSVVKSASEKQINEIAENIKAGVENYQIDFDFNGDDSVALDVETLPMAWDDGLITTRKECPQCPGFYGYTIRPYEQYRGLYKLTLRITHRTWAERGEPFREYSFVMSAK